MDSKHQHGQGIGTARLLKRFLRLLLPVFLVASLVGLNVLSMFIFGDERSTVVSRIGNLSGRTSTILNRLGSAATLEQRQGVLALSLSDPAVSCAVLTDADHKIIAAAPAGIGCRGSERDAVSSVALETLPGVKLAIRYNLTEVEQRTQLFRTFTWLSLLGSLFVAAAASWFSFRQIVGKPVDSLLKAIRRTQLEGMPAHVDHVANDELGQVIEAFNGMQVRLREEARRNAEALRRLDYVYNETPALMFSINDKGIIQTASGHWLDETGHKREEIAGAPLSLFLSVPGGESFEDVQSVILSSTNRLRDVPLVLRCKNGTSKDVLLSLVPDEENGAASKLCVLSDITGLKEAQVELRRQAVTDHLTGLPNRQGLFEHLAAMSAAERSADSAAMLFIDLDNFKPVNDTLGHEAGDILLKAAAGRLKNCISKHDFLARLGGDEFAVVLHSLRQPDDARIVGQRILKAFSNPFRLGEASAAVGTSIGVASFAACEHVDDILRLADLAMYQSKQAGKNTISFYNNELTAKVVSRDVIVRRIRDALAGDQFTFFLQPVIDLKTMTPAGAEALMRLNRSNDGMFSPGDIIRAAEETGLIEAITRWGVAEGLAIAERSRRQLGDQGRYLAVNLSPKQMTRAFINDLVDRLRARPDLARNMVFEITETALFHQGEDVSSLLNDIRSAGARLALDDFGTGYSSLGHLHRFPVDLIKLDRGFVSGLADNSEDAGRRRALIRATSAMAEELGMRVVAEGIEDQATLAMLRDFGIAYGQGFLFSPALPEEAACEWLDRFSRGEKAAPYLKVIG